MPGLVLQSVRRAGDSPVDGAATRVGFTASRRVGGAVARNRAKRRLRAAAAAVLPHRAKVGRDYVLIARGATLTRSFDDLVGDLDRALKRLDCVQNTTTDMSGDQPGQRRR